MLEVIDKTREALRESPTEVALKGLIAKSSYNRLDPKNHDTLIEANGERFSIEMVPDGQSERLTSVQHIFENTFGEEEVDPEDVLRAAVDGKSSWEGEKEATKYQVHNVVDSNNEIASIVTGGRLDLTDANNKSSGKQMFMISYAVTTDAARRKGLATEAFVSAITKADKDAHADGKELTYVVGEVNASAEEYVNSLGRYRVYAESREQPGKFTELRYIQPPLDFDPKTGLPAEGAGNAAEHLMISNYHGKTLEKGDVLSVVRAMYTWCNTWPRSAFESDEAHATHQTYVQGVWKEFKEQVEASDSLVLMSKETREQSRNTPGITIEDHMEADRRASNEETE